MNVLALEPYHGGSHKAFLDGWSAHSRHTWDILGLPPNKWKWRMRHAAITFAREVTERVRAGQTWDLLFVSEMLNLAEFLGLASEAVQRLRRTSPTDTPPPRSGPTNSSVDRAEISMQSFPEPAPSTTANW